MTALAKLILALFISLAPIPLEAQTISPTTIATAGQTWDHSSGISMDFTLGELAIQTYRSNDLTFSEGFHQPSLILPTASNDLISQNISIFPNPTSSVLNVVSDEGSKMDVELRAISGKLIHTYTMQGVGAIDVSNLVAGIYFISIVSRHRKPYLTRLIKI